MPKRTAPAQPSTPKAQIPTVAPSRPPRLIPLSERRPLRIQDEVWERAKAQVALKRLAESLGEPVALPQ